MFFFFVCEGVSIGFDGRVGRGWFGMCLVLGRIWRMVEIDLKSSYWNVFFLEL